MILGTDTLGAGTLGTLKTISNSADVICSRNLQRSFSALPNITIAVDVSKSRSVQRSLSGSQVLDTPTEARVTTQVVEVLGQYNPDVRVTAQIIEVLSSSYVAARVTNQAVEVLQNYNQLSDEDYLKWLKNTNAIRCVLVEIMANISGVETKLYLSNLGYVSHGGNIPSNTCYLPGIAAGVNLTEELTFEGKGGGLSFGDIEIYNVSGERDEWLDYIFDNREIKIYFGDIAWNRQWFKLVFNGIVASCQSKSRTTLNILIRDKLERLNCAMTTEVLGGDTDNKDAILPLTFGEACNVSPLLVNPALHIYQVHQGPIERLIEVRDNGYPVTAAPSLSAGTFQLVAAPAGTITASVQGYKAGTFYNDISNLIQIIVQNYGKASTRFVSKDLDVENLADFADGHTQTVGFYLNDRMNVLDVIQQLAASVGAQVVMNRAGQLRLLQVALPAIGTPTEFTPDNMVANSLHIVSRVPVKANAKIGYCKNWTVQQQVATGVLEVSAALFAKEWLNVTYTDPTTATDYKLDDDPVERDTLLLDRPEALDEATREVDLFKTQRTVFGFEGYADSLVLDLGDAITITHPRYGLSGGKTGIIVKLTPDWSKVRCGVEVLI